VTLKAWQVFVFSLIPLALVFIGVIGGSFHGADSAAEVFPTAAPRPAGGTGSGGGGTTGGGTATGANVLQITARNLLFDKRTLTAPANTQIDIQLDNQDPGALHNIAIYRDRSAAQRIFVGELKAGPTVIDNRFTTPGPGNYFFRCDAHPDNMTGTFTVR
jgi:plastocyanin